VEWALGDREAHRDVVVPLRRRAGFMVLASMRVGSLRARVRRRRVGGPDRRSKLRVDRRRTWGTRKPRRTARSIRRMDRRRRSREGSRGIGSEAALVLRYFYVSA
jgi:hypothetical protein